MDKTTTDALEELVQNQGFADSNDFCKTRLAAWLKRQTDSYCIMPDQKKQFEDIAGELALADDGCLKHLVERMGLPFYGYVKTELLSYWQEQTAHYRLLLSYYRLKYGQPASALATPKFHDYPFGILEKENDLWAWEDAEDFAALYEELINEWADAKR